MSTTPTLALPLRRREMYSPVELLEVISFPLRGKVGMGVEGTS